MSTETKNPLWNLGRAEIPREVVVCPECSGKLYAHSHACNADTGRPYLGNFSVFCENEDREGDGVAINHRWFQSDWSSVMDDIGKWCDAESEFE